MRIFKVSFPKFSVGNLSLYNIRNFKKERLLKLLLAFIIFDCLRMSCPGHEAIVIMQNKKLYQAKCQNEQRAVFYVKEYSTLEYDYHPQNPYSFKLLREKDGIYRILENGKIYGSISNDSDYFFLGPTKGGLGYIQVQIYCDATGELVFDTGKVEETKALCVEHGNKFFFLDGHAKRKEGDSCFPKGFNVRGLIEAVELSKQE